NFTDIIVTESNFTIEFNNQIDQSSLNGNINFASASGQTFDYFYDEYSKLLYVFPFSESEPFQPADTITVFLSIGITDLSESPLDSNYSLTYFTGPVVFPGDADNNGIVDERDILSLGLYWNLTGPAREIAGEVSPLEFFPSPGHFQVLSEKWEPNLAAYADADGSGIVNADDICGVSFNFGLSSQPAQKINGDMPAMKQLDNSVMQQLYNALIECPSSAGKAGLIEFIEKALKSQSVVLPTEVELYQNYPNPFNPSTMIEFYLPEQQYVTLDIYNILGQRVVSLVDRDMDAGFQSVSWSGRDNSGSEVASGIYFYLLKTDDRKISKRMMMLK
ncbi:MAG: T9SS type A sorting domain-containing protein, partial [candidate division Zixibacteria bacterium]